MQFYRRKITSLRDVHVPRIPWPRLAIPFAVIKITIPADSRWTYRSINQYDFRLHATRIIPLSLPIHPSSMGFVKGVDAQSDSRLNRSPNKGDGQFAYRFKGWSIFKPRFKRGLSPPPLSIFQLCNENDYLFIQATSALAECRYGIRETGRSLFML